jgi:mono/diheme cytochrome c family protein
MTAKSLFPILAGGLIFAALDGLAAEKKTAKTTSKPGAAKITFEDDVLPIFRDQCLKCHNPDKQKGDLDLTTYSLTLKGGGSGQALAAGDADGSKLLKSITHAEEPFMPPNSPKLEAKQIDIIRKWINGGLLETSGSKALTSKKPAVDLTLGAAAIGKPDGPPPMPGKLALNPVVVPRRGTALAAFAASPWAPVVALGGPKQVVLYNTDEMEFLGVLPFPEGFPSDAKFSRNGKLLLVAGGRGAKEGEVIVWDIAKGERVITIGEQYDSMIAADISADQKWIALGGPDRVVKIYDTTDGSLDHKIKKHTDWVTAVEFSPDGKYLVTGDRAGGLWMWEAATGQEMFPLNGHKGAITSVSWRGDSGVVLSTSEDGTIKLWKPSDGQQVNSWSAHNGGVLCARFTHDGRIVSSGRDNKVQTWNAGGSVLKPLAFTGELPNRVTFSHDGKRVIGSDYDGRVLVWNAEDGKQIGELESNPPTLAARVERDAKRIPELQAAADKAAADHAMREAEAKIAADNVEKAKQSLLRTRADQLAREKDVKALGAELAKNAADQALKARLNEAREAVKKLQKEIDRGEEEVVKANKQAGIAQQKVAEAKTAAEQALKNIAGTKASLAKWKTALQSEPSKPKLAAK